jgi:hypothetical protein
MRMSPDPHDPGTLPRLARKARAHAQRSWHRAQGKPCLHFLHLGKTGGSAVKHAIEHCANPHLCYVIYLHGHETTLRDVPCGHKFFFFLRDPLSRFVSGFYSRQRQGRPRYYMRWTPGEQAAFERFETPNALALALSSADPAEREAAEAAMREILHVRDSYWNWFESRDYFLSRLGDLFFIGFQEQLSEDFEVLRTKLFLPCSALPQDDVFAHRNPVDLDRSLESNAVANLKRWYAEDYAFLELCHDIVRQRKAVHGPLPAHLMHEAAPLEGETRSLN